MTTVLFVCLGNICRSPAAEAILRHKAKEESSLQGIHVESCGLGDWHVGQLPDERMREAAKIRGYVLSSRAQQFDETFLDRFDFILAADTSVLNELYRFAKTPQHKAKIHLFTQFSLSYQGQEVPDPYYYQGEAGFQQVLDIIEDACEGLIGQMKK